MHTIRSSIFVIAMVAVATPACSRGGDNKVIIMVGGVEKQIYLPAKLAESLGAFERASLEVELLSTPAGVEAANELLAGAVHAVVGFYDHTIDLQTKGKCITSVVQFADVPGEVEMVAAGKAATIRSPADFKGRKLGVTSPGSSTDFLTQYLATKAGLTGADYTTVKAGAGQTFIAAIDNGGIDAGMTTDPTAAKLISTGKAKVLLDMRTEEGARAALGGLYPASSLYMDCAWVSAHPEQVQKLANALVKTLRWIKAHPPEEIAAKMPGEYSAGDPKLYVQAVRDSIGMFNGDGVMKPEGAKNVLEVLSQFSPNVKGKKDQVDLSKTYTTAYVSKVAP